MTVRDWPAAQDDLVRSPERSPGALTTRTGVPWATVLPLSIVLALADGFWMTSLRGAVGYIERAQSPFTSWIRESALSVPLFVLAVLGALTLALRVFGPTLRGRAVVATMLLIAAAATVVGFAEIAASSAYDYHLQVRQLAPMDHLCELADCGDQRQQASLQLQVRAVGLASLLLLATNLVVVGWAVALTGGRLSVSRTRRRRTGGLGARLDTRHWALVTALIGAAAIHAAVLPEHFNEWPAAGAFFVGLAAAELTVATLVVREVRSSLHLAAVVSVAPLMLWLYSRTAGIPFGPEAGTAENVGLADVAASALEMAALLLALLLLRARSRAGTGRAAGVEPWHSSAHVHALVVVAFVAVTAVGLAGSGLAWLDVVSVGEPPGGDGHAHTR